MGVCLGRSRSLADLGRRGGIWRAGDEARDPRVPERVLVAEDQIRRSTRRSCPDVGSGQNPRAAGVGRVVRAARFFMTSFTAPVRVVDLVVPRKNQNRS
jgi:hypothetical protein